MPDRADPHTEGQTVLADRYVLGRQLGAGGMSQVYAAHDRLLDREVAAKVFGPAVDPAAPERQRAEMRTLARLSHPRLVALHDAGTHTGAGAPGQRWERAYLVMELIDGPSLAEVLHEGPLAPERTQHLGAGVADALDYVHSRDVVHRDVKPANILLDQRGEPHLADFGIAQALGDAALTQTGLTIGTVAYLSPEQVRGQTAGPSSDIYALGLVLLECLTGRREYPGSTAETALARLTRQPHVDPGLPAPWPTLLTAMLAAEPAARPTAAQVAFALETGVYDGRAAVTNDEPYPATVTLASTAATTTLPAAPEADPHTRLLTREVPRRRQSAPRATSKSWFAGASRRTVVVTAAALLAVLLVVVALSSLSRTGSSGAGSGAGASSPSGPAGPTRLGPDLQRLRQLVQP